MVARNGAEVGFVGPDIVKSKTKVIEVCRKLGHHNRKISV